MHTPADALAEVPAGEALHALPKADLHQHQEWWPRLDRIIARREHRPPYDWHTWAHGLMANTPAGSARLAGLDSGFSLVSTYLCPEPANGGEPRTPALDATPEDFIARVEDLLEEAARDGTVLVEVRFGGETALTPDFMALFREAERRVRSRFPALRAEAICSLLLWYDAERLERVLAACLQAAQDGLGGLDLLYAPYDREADWHGAYRVAERAVAAGLGITVHAGEFSTANIAAALRTPGITRLGHAVYAAQEPRLLDAIAAQGITVECCLTSNVVLGAVPSYAEHPIRRFVEAGIAVALATDNPVRVPTTIGREYAIAYALGCSEAELLGFTANAVRASFAPRDRKAALLAALPAVS
ncbi:MAG: amidohydrolase family protein [Dehalococcoidia bacterium]